ncbi:hypothetical protein [Bradyrhizobium sp. Ash2021]|uniref:hypothetical protein n=1 Tax=Bradyrhizobium sp. Ash2021 TaxID=2954771 RepID=UPI002815A2E1|nr:hypothetical protein [Bradyrhizobium sp. Ash2021]WMT72878.1 hypothetical protein NL528_33575 [Bradyrhizobium sp. Ash2021]
MSSGDLIPNDHDHVEPGANEVQFALVIARIRACPENQAHDFTVEGKPVDPKQCIERIVATNGTFYTDCKKP